MTALVVLALVLGPRPAAAQDGATALDPPVAAADELEEEGPQERELRVQLDVARRYRDDGQCELAIARLRRVLQLDPLSADGRFYLGTCLHAVGRHAEAIPELESFFTVAGPVIDPERADVASRVLEYARRDSAALRVVVEPAGALVTVDGRPLLGDGERSMRVDPGVHVIRAELDGWSTVVRDVEVQAGERAWRLVQLTARRASLQIDADAAGASVVLDGRRVAAGEPVEVAPGWHRVAVSAPDHAGRERDVLLIDGDRLRLDVSLAPVPRETSPVEILAPVLGAAGAVVIGVAIGLGVALAQ